MRTNLLKQQSNIHVCKNYLRCGCQGSLNTLFALSETTCSWLKAFDIFYKCYSPYKTRQQTLWNLGREGIMAQKAEWGRSRLQGLT